MNRSKQNPAGRTALVLDAHECHALAAIRSLGRRGVRITAASHNRNAMGWRSRYCRERSWGPSPGSEPLEYAAWLLEMLRARRFDALLFFGEASANIVALHRDAVQAATGCPLPPLETFLTADRKDRVLVLASAVGVPVPASHAPTDPAAVRALASRLEYPVIVKGVLGSGGHQVAFVAEPAALEPAVERVAALRSEASQPYPVVQEYIPGRGYGLTALCRTGVPLAVFMHRRLVEHDVMRGAGLAHATPGAESIFEPELRDAGLALLAALKWDGVAMVEFRRSVRDGRFYLMEINPRFPGSLDLGIASGVDFPWLYYQLATGTAVQTPRDYRIGLRYHWLLSKNIVQAFESPRTYLGSVVAGLRPDTRTDLCATDPGPHYTHLRAAAWWVRQHLRSASATGGSTAAAATPVPDATGTRSETAPAELEASRLESPVA